MLAPRGLGDPSDPNEERRAPFMAFWSKGLLGKPNTPGFALPLLATGLPWFENGLRGELEKLRLLPADPEIEGVREKRGGVLYTEPGVGGAEEGGRPSSFRWLGVRGMSEKSSLCRARGSRLVPMLKMGTARMAQYTYRE